MKNNKKAKIVFAGTSFFAKNILEELLSNELIEVACVYCQPWKKSNKNEVYEFCKRLGLNVLTPLNFNDESNYLYLKQIQPDLLLTCAYGQFISCKLIDLFTFKAFNLHASLLPKFRGGNPIQQAIIDGEKETGVCLIKMEKKMDAGDIYFFHKVNIEENDYFKDVEEKLINISKRFINKWIIAILENRVHPHSQEEKKVSYAYHLEKEAYLLNFDDDVHAIYNKIRSARPKEEFYFLHKNKRYKIIQAEIVKENSKNYQPNKISIDKSVMLIETKNGSISIKSIQPENKKILDIHSFIIGNKSIENDTYIC